MKRKLRVSALTAAACLSGWPALAVPPRVETATVQPFETGDALRCVAAFHSALTRADVATAASLLADDATIFEEGDAETTKAQYVGSHLPADIAFLRTVQETVINRIGQQGADQAWVATQGHMTGRYHDKDVDRLTTETMVLRRSLEGWRIVHIHWSSKAADGR